MFGNVYKDMRETEALSLINVTSKYTNYLKNALKFSSVPMK